MTRQYSPGGLDVRELSRLANDLFKQMNAEPSVAAPTPAGVSSLSEQGPAGSTEAQPLSNPLGSQQPSRAALEGPLHLSDPAFHSFGGAQPHEVPHSNSPNFGGASNGSSFRPESAHVPPSAKSNQGASTLGGFPSEQPTAAPSSAYYFLDHTPAGHGSHDRNFEFQDPSFGAALAIPRATSFGGPLDISRIRADFPILSETVNGRPLVWLDNAATTQKPKVVIDRLSHFYEHENSNIHRAAHELAARATDAYEDAREKVRGFLNARTAKEIVFARGAMEAINLVAQSWGRANIHKGDEIILSHLEHHANIVPWQLLAEEKGAKLRVIPVDDHGQVLLSDYGKLLSSRTKLVSFTHVSNALGTVTPAREIVAMAHAAGACTLVDGAQAVSHMPVDVQSLDADFYVFSGHKVFGPTGIGVLFGKESVLNNMPPWQGGGNMIEDVTFERSIFQKAPGRFEAGTGNIADAVGLGAAIQYVTGLGMANIEAYEHGLLDYGTRGLSRISGLKLIGTAPEKAGVLSFVLDGFKTDELSHALNAYGIAVRGGHHCAQPILRRMGLQSTVRPSLAFYNTCADLDALVDAILRIRSDGRLPSTPAFR